MEGPSQARIECDDKGDGSCDVRYWPQEAGEYAVHVLCNSEDIRLSPFMADIREAPQDFHPDRVKGVCCRPPSASAWGLGEAWLCWCPDRVFLPLWVLGGLALGPLRSGGGGGISHQVKARGPGLEKTGVAVNKPAEFTVDAKHGGKASLRVQVQVGCPPVVGLVRWGARVPRPGPSSAGCSSLPTSQDNEGCPVEAAVKDNGNGTYSCSYVPRKPVKHTAMVSWGGVSIPNSPFRVSSPVAHLPRVPDPAPLGRPPRPYRSPVPSVRLDGFEYIQGCAARITAKG